MKYDNFSEHPDRPHRKIVSFVSEGSTVLDIGCSTGRIGNWLKKNKECTVFGVEPREEAAQKADAVLDEVYTGFYEDVDIGEKFDYVILSDVLEHVADPDAMLEEIKDDLKPGGSLVVSLPNAVNWRVRVMVLFGKFDYKEYGIMDKTHLRFYTRETGKEVLERNGYDVETVDPAGYLHGKVKVLPGLTATHFVYLASLS